MSGLTRREADIFACLVETICAPGDGRPSAGTAHPRTAFERALAAAPPLNRFGLRALLYAAELAPRLHGQGARLRRLGAAERRAALGALAGGPIRAPLEGLTALVKMSYWSEPALMRSLGYDADAVVVRGRELRRLEARW